jgi:hypothetical protein
VGSWSGSERDGTGGVSTPNGAGAVAGLTDIVCWSTSTRRSEWCSPAAAGGVGDPTRPQTDQAGSTVVSMYCVQSGDVVSVLPLASATMPAFNRKSE